MVRITDLKEYKEKLRKYKEAKQVLPHLEAILKVFTLSVKALQIFKAYMPAAKVLKTIEDQKAILESHIFKYKKTIEEYKNEKS